MAKYNYKPMTAPEFARSLDDTGLTLGQWCRLTGYDFDEVREEWLTKRTKDIPHIVRIWFAMYQMPNAPQIARMMTDAVILGRQDDDIATEMKREYGSGSKARERGNAPGQERR